MSEELKLKRPRVVTNVFIFNSRGEIFLMRSPKWSNLLLGPGGHVEHGESVVESAQREVREEVGFEIEDLELLRTVEIIDSPEFTKEKKHFIAFDYRARLSGAEDQEPRLDQSEASEYMWIKPEDAVKRDDLETTTRETIEKCILKKEKHGIFHCECKKCEELKKECEEYKTGWQRALADYKNLQAETSKRRTEWAQMSEQQILEEFIPVYDHLKMSMAHCHSRESGNPDAWVEGVKHVLRQFSEILKAHGVEEIKTVGEKFDPAQHEAGGEEAVEGQESGIVIREIMPGYRMGERVIRAARVIITK